MPVNLSAGILPGLEVADQLRNSRAARESTAQADMIKLNEFQTAQQQEQLEANAANSIIEIMKGDDVEGQGAEAPPESNFGAFFQRLGEQMYKAGAPKRGQELIEAAVDFRKKEADISQSEASAQKSRLEGMVKAGGYMYNALGTAKNESEYRYLLDTIPDDVVQILGPENVQTLKDQEWSPELQGYLRERALGIKDSAELALSERRVVNAETATQNAKDNAAALRALNAGRLREQVRANDIREKALGTSVGKASTPQELNAAKAVIVNSIEGLSDVNNPATNDALEHMAQDIVGRAKTLVDANKGMTFAQGLEQATMEAQNAGDFKILEVVTEENKIFPDKKETRGQYKRTGTSPDNPRKLPEGDSATVSKKLIKGRYYETPLGVLRWTGTDFEQ